MKPTQQEIIEQLGEAFDRAVEICGREFVANSLLDRFSAGGGEPVAYMCPTSRAMADGSMEDGPDYLEWADEASDYEKRVGTPLYTHPSPTDLRAEYLRGLEEGFKEGWIECSKWAQRDDLIADIGSPSYEACVSAVKALKGKQ